MYIYIDRTAVFEIARNRKFQTTDFEEARRVLNFIRQQAPSDKIGSINLEWIQDNAYIYCANDPRRNCLVFDLTNFYAFMDKSDIYSLSAFNRVIKLCVRLWDSLSLSSSERAIKGNVYIVFPFPPGTDNAYRILVCKNPDQKRDEPRNRFNFLVFGEGTSDNLNTEPSENSIKEYKTAIEKSEEILKDRIPTIIPNGINEIKQNGCFRTFETQTPVSKIDGIYSIEDWKYYLSDIQKRIVFGDIKGPLRIEGAAGTGKTLAMILKSINMIMTEKDQNNDFSVLFITHSVQVKNNIISIIKDTYPEIERYLSSRYNSSCYLKITTLQELCIELLGSNLNCIEYLDLDAMESKKTQLLYLLEVIEELRHKTLDAYQGLISNAYFEYLMKSDPWHIAEMLRHEIGVVIKGRAQEDMDTYMGLNPRPKYSLPLENDHDFRLTYSLYTKYKEKLIKTNSFDSDDIVLSSYNTLTTPIWRRRRSMEGFNVILVDETHLFNLNELSIIHHMLKEDNNQIIFSIDKSQAIGDLGYNKEFLTDMLVKKLEGFHEEKFNTVFRSSTDIVNLTSWVLSSGTTLFSSIDNNYIDASSAFNELDERKIKKPNILYYKEDNDMFKTLFKTIDDYSSEMNVSKSNILVIATDEQFFSVICKYCDDHNKSYEKITKRGDVEKVNVAIKSSKYMISHIDYVGGLEFDGVIIVGAEKGLFPNYCDSTECRQFISYATYNRIYVAMSRAKYRLTFIVNEERGISEILESAINRGLIVEETV